MESILSIYSNYRIAIIGIALGMASASLLYFHRDRRLDTIPGPKEYSAWVLGPKLPSNASDTFRNWALEYGDIFKLRVGLRNWVVINTPEAVREILEKQAVSTSSKAPSPMGHDIVTVGKRMPTMSYGPHWRAQRSVVRQITTVPMTATFVPSQEFEAKQLLFDLANSNDNQRDFYQHMRRFAFSVIMTNTFGVRVKTWEHPDAQNAIRSQSILRATSRPGAFIVDEIPLLAYLPSWLRPGRRFALDAAATVREIKMGLWGRMEAQFNAGTAPPSYARDILDNKKMWHEKGLDDEDLAWVAGGLVEAGFETSAATLNSLVLHLASDKDVQQEAHDEIMRVVGPNRLPTFEDLKDMPYVRACVKEMLRMNPILAPGIRAYTSSDVTYKDHVIPKGTVLLTNTAFLHFDPSRFQNPFSFQPSRYVNHKLFSSEYAAMSDPYARDHFTFSTGRRVCPGARLAENSLGIALAGILWAFDICPPIIDGTEVPVQLGKAAYPDAGFTIPKPFMVRFTPRSSERKAILEREWKKAESEGYNLRGFRVDVDGTHEF